MYFTYLRYFCLFVYSGVQHLVRRRGWLPIKVCGPHLLFLRFCF